jgi:uncharacterized protein (TIGR03435 family)
MPSNLLYLLGNHLWQSTLVVAAAALVALALNRNEARVRYAVWIAASLKFLVPFSLLMDLGSRLAKPAPSPLPVSGFSFAFNTVVEPFAQVAAAVMPPAPLNPGPQRAFQLPEVLTAVWLCGAVVVLFSWLRARRRFIGVKRQSTVLTKGFEHETVRRLKGLLGIRTISVMSTAAAVEPGVFGVFRPVLLLPSGIHDRVTQEEFDAIVAHELEHVRRRDNLLATIHVIVEMTFWFYPIVWWLKARLIRERERACDEAVLRMGKDRRTYAESILKICELCLEKRRSFCVSTVTGSNLKQRIEQIMKSPIGDRLSFTRKIVVAATAIVAFSAPIFIGFAYAPELRAQSQGPERLAFEVASVKPNKPGGYNTPREVMQSMMLQYLPGGRFSARGVPVPILIFEAYTVAPGPSRRISLSPEFEKSIDRKMESETYDIEAVAEKGAIPANASTNVQKEKIRFMLQTLLADRFKVRITHEMKDVPVYAIAVGKNGPKLQKSAMDEAQCAATSADKPEIRSFFAALDPSSCHAFVGGVGRGLRGEAIDMSDLARAIESFSDRPVVNETGLTGLYKIETPGWTPLREAAPRPPGTEPTAEERAFADPARPTLSDVLQDLGLRLESTKATVEMFVVEHFERPALNQ